MFWSFIYLFIYFINLRILLKFKTFLRDWPWWLVTTGDHYYFYFNENTVFLHVVVWSWSFIFKWTVQFKRNSTRQGRWIWYSKLEFFINRLLGLIEFKLELWPESSIPLNCLLFNPSSVWLEEATHRKSVLKMLCATD